MAVDLIWSPLAKADFREAVAYIRKDNAGAADAWRKSLLERVELLAEFPELGRLVPKQENLLLREVIYGRHRIVYRYVQVKNSLQILRVWHSARGEPNLQG